MLPSLEALRTNFWEMSPQATQALHAIQRAVPQTYPELRNFPSRNWLFSCVNHPGRHPHMGPTHHKIQPWRIGSWHFKGAKKKQTKSATISTRFICIWFIYANLNICNLWGCLQKGPGPVDCMLSNECSDLENFCSTVGRVELRSPGGPGVVFGWGLLWL